MNTYTKIYDLSDFSFPTKNERLLAYKNCQDIENFGFKNQNDADLFDMQNFRNTHLVSWDLCLTNKLGKLKETYIIIFSIHQRLIKDNYPDEGINIFFFEYFTEIFCHFFFSTRDTIAQIINKFLSVFSKDDKVYFNELMKKNTNPAIKELMSEFIESTQMISDYRNNFTHNYPINFLDDRIEVSEDNGRKSYLIRSKKPKSPDEIMKTFNESYKHLTDFVNELRKEFGIEINRSYR